MRLIDADALLEFVEGLYTVTWDHDYDGGIKDACIDILNFINNAPTIDALPRWIPCEERLPEEYGLYIATMNDGSVQECSYVPTDYGDVLLNGWSTCEASGFKVLNENDVLAWMPLPEPYDGERKDDETD